jgi:hypothetical protein
MPESDVRRLREVARENPRLEKLLAEREVEINLMKGLVQECSWHRSASTGGEFHAVQVCFLSSGRRHAGHQSSVGWVQLQG